MHVPDKYMKLINNTEREYRNNLSKSSEFTTPKQRYIFKNKDRQDQIKVSILDNNPQRMYQNLVNTDHSADYEILGATKFSAQLSR